MTQKLKILFNVRKGVIKTFDDYVKFKCNFINGECASYRKRIKTDGSFISSTLLSSGCCCSYCKVSNGYLRYGFNKIPEIMEMWNNENGFFEKGKGCRLPKHFRNAMCLTHYCEDAVSDLEIKKQIAIFRSIIEGIDYKIHQLIDCSKCEEPL